MWSQRVGHDWATKAVTQMQDLERHEAGWQCQVYSLKIIQTLIHWSLCCLHQDFRSCSIYINSYKESDMNDSDDQFSVCSLLIGSTVMITCDVTKLYKWYIHFFFFFFWVMSCSLQDLSSWPETEPMPQQWKCPILTTGSPGSSEYIHILMYALALCNPMNCSMPGFLVLHYLPEFAHIHVHWVSDAI